MDCIKVTTGNMDLICEQLLLILLKDVIRAKLSLNMYAHLPHKKYTTVDTAKLQLCENQCTHF